MCTAGEFRMEFPGFFFGYSGAFGESGYVFVIGLVAASFGICLGALNGSGGMVRWCIDRGKLQGTMSDVDDVVPYTARDENTVSLAEFDLCIQTVLIVAHANQSNSRFHANELVCVFMNLQTDIATGMNAHERHLQICSGPEGRTEILVMSGGAHDVCREWS